MNKAICVIPVSPMRAEPSHKSEQVSQLIFGDTCTIIETTGDFSKVISTYDSYTGWCQKVQLQSVADDQSFFPVVLVDAWVGNVKVNNTPMQVAMGSNIGFITGGNTTLNALQISTQHKGFEVPLKPDVKKLFEIAHAFLNTSYQWGGRTVFGVDCSGFTQMVFKFGGISLHRDASQQVTQGAVVDFLQEVTFGDLAFFDNEEGKITHVGIMLNSNTIIHASGKVRIDAMDQAGIINSENGERTHKLRIIKRVI